MICEAERISPLTEEGRNVEQERLESLVGISEACAFKVSDIICLFACFVRDLYFILFFIFLQLVLALAQ